jgi:hypothetical protein
MIFDFVVVQCRIIRFLCVCNPRSRAFEWQHGGDDRVGRDCYKYNRGEK